MTKEKTQTKTMVKKIYVAGGCFWGVEHYFSLHNAILETSVGYLNSKVVNPSYEQVCSGITHAVEAVELQYDANKISVADIVLELFAIINPTSLNKQGNDIGNQYRTGIYSSDPKDLQLAQYTIDQLQKNYQQKIVVEVLPLQNYYLAEEYHQKYLVKNPFGYCHIPKEKFKERG